MYQTAGRSSKHFSPYVGRHLKPYNLTYRQLKPYKREYLHYRHFKPYKKEYRHLKPYKREYRGSRHSSEDGRVTFPLPSPVWPAWGLCVPKYPTVTSILVSQSTLFHLHLPQASGLCVPKYSHLALSFANPNNWKRGSRERICGYHIVWPAVQFVSQSTLQSLSRCPKVPLTNFQKTQTFVSGLGQEAFVS